MTLDDGRGPSESTILPWDSWRAPGTSLRLLVTRPRKTIGGIRDGRVAPAMTFALGTACVWATALLVRVLIQFPNAVPWRAVAIVFGSVLSVVLCLGASFTTIFYFSLRRLGSDVRFSHVARVVGYLQAFSVVLAGHAATVAIRSHELRGLIDLGIDVAIIAASGAGAFWFAAEGVALPRSKALLAALGPTLPLLVLRILAEFVVGRFA